MFLEPYDVSSPSYIESEWNLYWWEANTLEHKLLYLPKNRLEVTSSAIVVLTAFLDSPNFPKEILSGLKEKFPWRDT